VQIIPPGGSVVEGNSILYILLKLAIKGQYLPSGDVDVFLSPMALGAWVGMLVTFINLMPIGQLDGGHVAVAFFGERHEGRARWLHRGLLVVGAGVLAWLLVDFVRSGASAGEALGYSALGALPWVVWALMILGMRRMAGGMYHPPVDDAPLSPSRRALFWLVAVVFLLIFTPIPMRVSL
jgi:membrane-associated protease RseP (regulator of RpoE activity)